MFGSFSRAYGRFETTTVYSGQGADIVIAIKSRTQDFSDTVFIRN